VIDQRVIPHTENFRMNLIESAVTSKPAIETSALDMAATLTWPAAFLLTNIQQQGEIRSFLVEVSGRVLCTTCVIENVEALVGKLYDDEAVQERMAMITVAPTSYHRIASRSLSRISDWQDAVRREYPIQGPRPQLTLVELDVPEERKDDDGAVGENGQVKSHRALRVRSVIDAHAWDQAQWSGACYMQMDQRGVPGIGLVFTDKEAARKIFERWRQRFGDSDANEEIYLAIVRHLPHQNPDHYVMLITSKYPDANDRDPNQLIVTASRSITMTANSKQNLQRFLDAYYQFGEFYLLPAVITDGVPEVIGQLALLKRHISVKDAASVGDRDIEIMAIRRAPSMDENVRP
jgi:hypothetical protein